MGKHSIMHHVPPPFLESSFLPSFLFQIETRRVAYFPITAQSHLCRAATRVADLARISKSPQQWYQDYRLKLSMI